MSRPPLRVLIAVGLISGCALAQQVLLTRMLSAVLFYHFTFLAISLALLGTGMGGIAVYVKPRAFDGQSLERVLSQWSLIFAGLMIIVPTALVRLDYTYNNTITVGFGIGFTLACIISLLPFAAAGIALTVALRGYSSAVGRVYGFDLVGAGLGAALVVPVMWIVSVPTGMVVLGLVAALASVLFAWRISLIRRAAVGVAMVGAVVTTLSATTGLNYLPSPYFPGVTPLGDRWTPLDRVLSFAPPHPERSPFGFLFYDRVYAPIPIHHPGTPYPTWKQLQTVPESVGLAVANHGRVLVMGGGGGRDIYDALSSGFRHVDVIELNSAIVDMVDQTAGFFSGSPYTAPGVHTTVGDGRSVLASRTTTYDEIHIGFTDTLSGSSADAFALSENNLYTLQALKDRGITDPDNHVVVLTGLDQFGAVAATVLSQLTPFTPHELTHIRSLAKAREAEVVFAPGGPYRLQWATLHRAPNLSVYCTHYKLDVCPTSDDKPFFFNMTRLSGMFRTLPSTYLYTIQPFTLLTFTTGLLLLLALVGFSVPLFRVDRRSRPPKRRLVYFAAIGIGFLTLEVTLIQRFVLFLGFPTYALTVVLSSLLIFTGIGAWMSSRWRDPRRALTINVAALCVLIALSAYWLQPALGHMIGLPFAARAVLSVAMLAPFGICLGMVMPMGLRRLVQDHPESMPWAWGVNGFTSVFGAALGVFVAIEWGFAVATLVALGCYVVVGVEAAMSTWASPDGDKARSVTDAHPELASPVS